MITRIQPPVCTKCGAKPWLCESCGDYQCRCIVPWLAVILKEAREKGKRGPRILVHVHYDKLGQPYPAQFIDGYEFEDYPSEEDDMSWLIEGGFS